jgi:hypothetical protein
MPTSLRDLADPRRDDAGPPVRDDRGPERLDRDDDLAR